MITSLVSNTVRVVSAECSRGKTLAACKYIRERRGLSNYLYVAPTKRLLKQTRQTLEDLGLRADVIDEDNQPNVNAAITSALKDAPSEGAVLLITWKAYADLSYFHDRECWTRIIDEVPQLDVFRPYKLPYNYRFLSDHIEIKRSVNEHISEVKAKDYWALKHFLGKARDDVHDLFDKLFRDLLSPNKAVYVDSESWTRITEHQVVSKDEEKNRIFFLTLLKPNLFQDAILLGANIVKSMVHDWLSRYHRYQFVEEADIAQNLRSLPDNLGQRLEISHFGFDKLFSKWQRDKPSENGGSVLSKMEEQVIAEFGREPFLFTLNNDRDDKRLLEAGGTRIPAIAHGLNEFQAYRNVFFGAALNREPKHNRMLLDLGFSSRCIQQSALEVTYQATMRSALRDFGSTETVRVVVPDVRAA